MDRIRFLMSDTDANITRRCREALEKEGVEVTVVDKDGTKVLQKMLIVRPNVVLLDAFMPGLDALTIKQRYDAAGEGRAAFFVTGAFQSEEMVQELLDAGFSYYFVKPFEESVLVGRVLKAAAMPVRQNTYTTSDSDEINVTEIMHQLGVPAHIKGYQYLREAILMAMKNPDYINAVTKRLYPQPGGACHPPRHRGGLGPGRRRHPQPLFRLYHPQHARQTHQQRIHRHDRRQDAPGQKEADRVIKQR